MIKKFIKLRKIFGNRNYFLLISVLFFSIISGFLELIGIGLIGAFAITVNDPSYVIEKIPFKNLQSFLFAYEKIDLIILFSVSIVVIFFLKHLISFSLNFLEITISKKILLNIKKKIFSYFLNQNY